MIFCIILCIILLCYPSWHFIGCMFLPSCLILLSLSYCSLFCPLSLSHSGTLIYRLPVTWTWMSSMLSWTHLPWRHLPSPGAPSTPAETLSSMQLSSLSYTKACSLGPFPQPGLKVFCSPCSLSWACISTTLLCFIFPTYPCSFIKVMSCMCQLPCMCPPIHVTSST